MRYAEMSAAVGEHRAAAGLNSKGHAAHALANNPFKDNACRDAGGAPEAARFAISHSIGTNVVIGGKTGRARLFVGEIRGKSRQINEYDFEIGARFPLSCVGLGRRFRYALHAISSGLRD